MRKLQNSIENVSKITLKELISKKYRIQFMIALAMPLFL